VGRVEGSKRKVVQPHREAYLDIETTGLYPGYSQITVVGIYITHGTEEHLVQLVGDKISGDSILETLDGVSNLYTYNGSRFDLPFIHSCHGVDLVSYFDHCDLMFHCWRNNLYGGLKKVETCLGIERQLKDVNGYLAVKLWWEYVNNYNEAALRTLLDYNREDVINLKALRDKLLGFTPAPEI
jgi:uncharacterized protein YprB with RNaseH-like and TPR domain